MPQSFDLYSLANRVAVVTGAAGGIGSAISERLCELGAHVVMADMTEGVTRASDSLNARSYSTEPMRFDVTASAEVDAAAVQVVATHGKVDILVACAGISYESTTVDHSDDDWRKVMAINLDGVFYCVRAFGRHMVARKAGSVVCISSIAAVKAVRPEIHAGYDVSKAGVAHLCRVIGVEWAPFNVRINAVGPGYTDTDMLKKVGVSRPDVMRQWLDDTPTGRLMQPSEIASSVAFLASDAAAGITGQLLMVDGGYSAS